MLFYKLLIIFIKKTILLLQTITSMLPWQKGLVRVSSWVNQYKSVIKKCASAVFVAFSATVMCESYYQSYLFSNQCLLIYIWYIFLFFSCAVSFFLIQRLYSYHNYKNAFFNFRSYSFSSVILPICALWRSNPNPWFMGKGTGNNFCLTNTVVERLPLSPDAVVQPPQEWCFLARLLGGVDPFDISYWTSPTSYPFVFIRRYILSPEFFPADTFEWVQQISQIRITSNFFFFWDLDGINKLFLLVKCFGRYGAYIPELIVFGLLCYLFIRMRKVSTNLIYYKILNVIRVSAILSLITLFTPFAACEIATGYKIDGYGEIIKFIFLLIVFFYFTAVGIWELTEAAKREVYLITVFFILFGLTMISCSNFWIFFFSLEGISFCIIIFFVFNFSGHGSIADAIRYFCLNSIASGALLVSLGLGSHVTGTAHYHDFGNFFFLNENIAYVPESFNAALILFLIGSLFKLGIFPFNVYEVDTYKNSSYIVIYFAAIVSKVPFFFIWLKLVWRVIPFVKVIFPALLVLGFLTTVIGTIAALFQTDLRAFLTYSSMSHIGLIIASFTTETALGVDAAILYYVSYIFAMSGIYYILTTLEGMGLDLHAIHQLRELRINFPLTLCFSICLLTLAGFPLTIGFFAKMGVLVNFAIMGQVWLVILVLVLSVMSFMYYAKIFRVLWLEANNQYALRHVLTNKKLFKGQSLNRLFVGARVIAVGLSIFSLTIFFSFQIIVAITGTLWCVASYAVNWDVFIRRVFISLKCWLFFSGAEDFRLQKLYDLWHKSKRFVKRRTFASYFTEKVESDAYLSRLYARRQMEIPENSRLMKKK